LSEWLLFILSSQLELLITRDNLSLLSLRLCIELIFLGGGFLSDLLALITWLNFVAPTLRTCAISNWLFLIVRFFNILFVGLVSLGSDLLLFPDICCRFDFRDIS
jgi:hypothetical protein